MEPGVAKFFMDLVLAPQTLPFDLHCRHLLDIWSTFDFVWPMLCLVLFLVCIFVPLIAFVSLSTFYYNRYWMMWKLPMFGCTDGDQVLKEVAACKKDYPDHYIRVVGFNAERQVQMASFIVHKPE